MSSQQKNLVSALAAIILASVIVFGFDVDIFFWFDDPQALEAPVTTTALVTSVIDGDTFKAKIGTTTESVRLIGIDAAEIAWPSAENGLSEPEPECYGWEAREALAEYVLDREAVLATDRLQPEYDDYGRRLAYVYVEGELVNQKLIANGFAHELSVRAGYEKQESFHASQKLAQDEAIGLWAACE
ncbi:MAG: thermonuclease family protein [Candidatus Paceibacterota bacterium]